MRRHNPCLMLMVSVALPFLVGGLVSFVGDSSFYYGYLNLWLPPVSAPVWLFTPIWWLMYLLMGLAAFLVWQQNSAGVKWSILCYCAQLGFLLVWPLAFFAFQAYFIAAMVLAAQIVLVLLVMRRFFFSNFLSGALLIPYPLWLMYLFYLNLGIAYLN